MPVQAFTFEELRGECLKGTPDRALIADALNRFKHAQRTIRNQRLDILEFPYTGNKLRQQTQDNVFIRYHRAKRLFEIKVFEIGHYNIKQLHSHYLLHERKPEERYEMIIS